MGCNISTVVLFCIYLYMIIDLALRRKSFGCGTPIIEWLLGEYLAAFLIIVVTVVNPFRPRWLIIACHFTIVGSIVFLFFWNFFGTYWLAKNIYLRNNCLSVVSIVFICVYQLFVYFFFANLLHMIIADVCQYLRHLKRQKETMIELLTIYDGSTKKSPYSIEAFILENIVLLESIKLLEEEKKMIAENFEVEAKNEEELCPICMGELSKGPKVVNVCGKHDFHLECLVDWLCIKQTCPMCAVFVRPILIRKAKALLTE